MVNRSPKMATKRLLVVDILYSTLLKDSGFSFDLLLQRFAPKKGFVVSPYKNRETVIRGLVLTDQGAVKDKLGLFIKDNRDLLMSEGHMFGAWIESSPIDTEHITLYLDIARHFTSALAAKHITRIHHQKAYYDLSKGV